MKKDETSNAIQPLEGEGSYTAIRRYNQHIGDAIDYGDLEAAADAARRPLDAPDREELERAERQGKTGPSNIQPMVPGAA